MNTSYRFLALFFLLFVIGFVSVGCASQPTTQPTAEALSYNSALTADYENALDVPTQLALGTIKLEDTSDAVTAEQAAGLLPLWQALQGSVIQGNEERAAVLKAIENKMTSTQLEAIRAMQLTQNDLGGIGPGGGMAPQEETSSQGGTRPQGTQRQGNNSGRQGFDANAMATRRAEMESMSDEERQQMFAQFQRGGNTAAGSSALNMVIANVVRLLSERSGVAMVPPTNAAVQAAETPAAAPEATPTATVEPTQAPAQTAVPTESPTVAATPAPTATPTAVPTQVATQSTAAAAATPAPTATPVPEVAAVPTLVQIEDTDPGPPFTIVVSSNTAVQDPLVEASQTYKITGLVRNDGTETYDISAIHVTFYDADGFRGTYRKFPQPGTDGEWIWHGRTEAEFGCLLLDPGQSCPFSVEISAQNMAFFLIHADAQVTEQESVPMELSDIRIVPDATGMVHFTGKATNKGTVSAKNVTVEGTLINASGQIVSVGSTVVLEENIAPGASVSFDLRIANQAYTSYRLYVQAERDWD